GVDLEDKGYSHDACDRSDIADEIEAEPLVEGRIDGIGRIREQKRMAISGGAHDGFRCEVVGSTRAVFDNERLSETFLQPLSHEPSNSGVSAAGRVADDDAHRFGRIGLRVRETRHQRQRGSTRGQMQKSTAGTFHLIPPSDNFAYSALMLAARITLPHFSVS